MPPPLADAIAAIERRPQSGAEDLMVLEPYAMHVVYVRFVYLYCIIPCLQFSDYAKLTRKMGAKPAMASSNLRPKSIDHGSPAL